MRLVADKGVKFAVLQRHNGAAKHIPAMRRFNEQNLRTMLDQYAFVVAKPYVGTGGNRVVKIMKSGSGYTYHYRGARIKVPSWSALIHALHRIRKSRSFMLQQGISLATIQGRPVDYRVKLVKSGKHWDLRAVVGRVARPGLFVTNLCQGGTMLQGRDALRRTFPAKLVKSKIATMVGVARTCTYLLETQYPGIGQLGYDFGIDTMGRVWILEVNTKPH
jgi:hypothetical protein